MSAGDDGRERSEGTASRGGVDINYETQGSGPTLILHTGGGGDLRMWDLAGYTRGFAGRRLVLLDHRGHGRSGRPSDLERHRIDEYVDDVLAVADQTGAATFSFFGYSGGATVGYRLAARHPDRVDALIALGGIGSRPETEAEAEAGSAARRAFADRVRRGGSETLVRALLEDEPDIPGWFVEQMRSTDPDMFALQLEGLSTWAGPWDEFPRIAAPTLIVVGGEEGSGGVAAKIARRAAETIPDGRAEALSGLGHCVAFARAELVLPLAESFLDHVTGSSRA